MKCTFKSWLVFLLIFILLFSVMPVISTAATLVSTIEYVTISSSKIIFDEDDFYKVCYDETGQEFSYVKFSPPSLTYGALYYYSSSGSTVNKEITTAIKCYYNSSTSSLDRVFFLPNEEYTGTVSITYTAYNDDNEAICTGKVRITIGQNTSSVERIKYETKAGEDLFFNDEDFDYVVNDSTNKKLNFVKFDIPDDDYGKLYYYSSSKVSTSRNELTSSVKCYYDQSLNSLSKVVFVSNDGYTGVLSITYTAYDDNNDEICSGKIKIYVEENQLVADQINYQVEQGKVIDFDKDYFNDVCVNGTDRSLNYVKFSIPSSEYGMLSHNDIKITSSSTKYYYNGSPSLSGVTFVPDENFVGTFSISYFGYNNDAKVYTGKIRITVTEAKEKFANDIIYNVDANSKINLDAYSFNLECDNVTGKTLNYVKFVLPSPSYGSLYYDYFSALSPGVLAQSNTKYYYNSTQSSSVSKITFVPNLNYSGTFSVAYTGYNESGDNFTGKIRINVREVDIPNNMPINTLPSSNSSKYFKDVGAELSWATSYIDVLYEKGIIEGMGEGNYNPKMNISRGDFMLLLYRAFGMNATYTLNNFPDVDKSMYYYNAVASAKSLGIALGTDTGKFNPGQSLTRQDAMVLIKRTIEKLDKSVIPSDLSVLYGFTDYLSIKDYAVEAVSSFVKAKVVKGDNNNIYPVNYITRAEMAVLLYRVLNN